MKQQSQEIVVLIVKAAGKSYHMGLAWGWVSSLSN